MLKKYLKALSNIFYELSPLIRDVYAQTLEKENVLVSFCQMNTLGITEKIVVK